MTQKIRHYATQKCSGDQDASATVAISRDDKGRYVVSAGNLVTKQDGRQLVDFVARLSTLEKPQQKIAYKEQLRKPREDGASSGAGLGLLDIARKSSSPMRTSLQEQKDGRFFFSLSAVI
nr:SiaB family protein kinase [Pseudomonas sp. S9]